MDYVKDIVGFDTRTIEHQTATIGAIASTVAYEEGGAWFDEMFSYLKRNLRLLNDRMATNLPQVGYIAPQGTYIAWLDFSPLGLDDPAAYFRERAHVALTDGLECGRVDRGCARMNFAMQYPLLETCLDDMCDALRKDGLI